MKHFDNTIIQINLVALHGFTGNGLDFKLILNHLNLSLNCNYKFNLFAPTLLGHRKEIDLSCSIDDYIKQFSEYLSSISRLLKSSSNINILLGYSMGARLALLHSIQDSKLWDALILIGVNPGIKDEGKRKERESSDLALIQMLETNGIERFINYWHSLPIIKSQSRAPKLFLQSMLERKKSLNPLGLANSLMGFGQGVFPYLWDDICNLNLPILCVHGSLDEKYALINKAISLRNPMVNVESIELCGHAPHIEDASQVSSVVTGFVLDKFLLNKSRT